VSKQAAKTDAVEETNEEYILMKSNQYGNHRNGFDIIIAVEYGNQKF